MPLIGYVRVGGVSSNEAKEAIEAQLRQNKVLIIRKFPFT
jgi:protein involved in polysaccharide export with SLBB domain